MRILIVDNTLDRESWGAADICEHLRAVSPGVEIKVRRAPERDLPASPQVFDRVILTGSRTSCLHEDVWVTELDFFLKQVLDLNIPILGICYGHQSLVRVLAGRQSLRKSSKGEFGWVQMKNTGGSRLLKGLPEEFYTFSSHYEEVHALPAGATSFARSDLCEIQGYEFSDRPVFGIQFHPEKNLNEVHESYHDMKKRGDGYLFQRPQDGAKLYDETIGRQIFANFVSIDR